MDDNKLKEELQGIKDASVEKVEELFKSTQEKIEEQKNDIANIIDSKLEKFKGQEMGEEFKKNLTGELNEKMTQVIDMQKQVDAIDKQMKGGVTNQSATFKSEFRKELEENASFKNFLEGNATKAKFEMKAHLVTDSNASGDVIAAQTIAGVKYDPTRLVRMRDIVRSGGTTSSNKIRYNQENSFTNNAAMKAEASATGESEFHLVSVDANVETLGTHITMSKEMFEDLNVANSYIATRLPQKVLDVEDTQILTGTGTSPQIQGLAASGGGSAYAAAADASADTGFRNFFLPANYGVDVSGSVNEYDVLSTALYQMENNNYRPTAIVVHPFQWYALSLRKATDWQYVREGILLVNGVPVIKSTAQTKGSFLVGDFNQGAELFYRKHIGIEMSESNNDDFEKYMMTVRAVQRFVMPIYLSNAFVYGTFSAAKTALQ